MSGFPIVMLANVLASAAIVGALFLALVCLVLCAIWLLARIFPGSRWDRLEERGLDALLAANLAVISLLIVIAAALIAFPVNGGHIEENWVADLALLTLALLGLFLLLVLAATISEALALAFASGRRFLLRLVRQPLTVLREFAAAVSAALAAIAFVILGGSVAVAVAGAAGYGLWWLSGVFLAWFSPMISLSGTVALLAVSGPWLLMWLGIISVPFLIVASARIVADHMRHPRGGAPLPRFHVPWNDLMSASPAAKAARACQTVASIAINSLPGKGDEQVIFRGSARQALTAYSARMDYVQPRLSRYIDTPPERELLEIPPGFEGLVEPLPITPEAGDARIATLEFQESDPQLMLFGRVADAFDCLLRTEDFAFLSDIELVLRRLHWWERVRGEYPWIVVVRSEYRRALARAILPMRDWLGIGVSCSKPKRLQPQMRCNAGRQSGTISGYLSPVDLSARYPITCAHVLDHHCPQALVCRPKPLPQPVYSGCHEPDAALLLLHDCWQPNMDPLKVIPISTADGEQLLRRRIRRVGGSAKRATGYLKFPVTSYMTKDGVTEHFPTFVVYGWPKSLLGDLLSWPPLCNRFSQPGDSGSWVLLDEPNLEEPRWLGIVVAGSESYFFPESHVLIAKPLMRYFNRRMRDKGPLSPYLAER
ncbi:hypothetical protein ACCS92_10805 [Rhizobium ruizarguesonis]